MTDKEKLKEALIELEQTRDAVADAADAYAKAALSYAITYACTTKSTVFGEKND